MKNPFRIIIFIVLCFPPVKVIFVSVFIWLVPAKSQKLKQMSCLLENYKASLRGNELSYVKSFSFWGAEKLKLYYKRQ